MGGRSGEPYPLPGTVATTGGRKNRKSTVWNSLFSLNKHFYILDILVVLDKLWRGSKNQVAKHHATNTILVKGLSVLTKQHLKTRQAKRKARTNTKITINKYTLVFPEPQNLALHVLPTLDPASFTQLLRCRACALPQVVDHCLGPVCFGALASTCYLMETVSHAHLACPLDQPCLSRNSGPALGTLN